MKTVGFLLAAGRSVRFGSDKRRYRLSDGRSLLQASVDLLAPVCEYLLIAVRHGDDLRDSLVCPENAVLVPVSSDNAGMGDSIATLAAFLMDGVSATLDGSRDDRMRADFGNFADDRLVERFLPDPKTPDGLGDVAIMVALADMPFVKPETLHGLLRFFSLQNHTDCLHRPIVVPVFSNPCLTSMAVESTIAHPDTNASGQTVEQSMGGPGLSARGDQKGHPVVFSGIYLEALKQCGGDQGARHVLQRHAAAVFSYRTDDAGVVNDIDRPPDIRP